ncbi:hypothetical protein KAU33_15560 [Candidatus Dependentiae bacterium]|nr:hypothetical protein [Candidatus Dependentiae bacterium]
MIDKDILTEDERRAFKSMGFYWKEVMHREDQTPLIAEAIRVDNILGIRVLRLVEEYMKATEPEE